MTPAGKPTCVRCNRTPMRVEGEYCDTCRRITAHEVRVGMEAFAAFLARHMDFLRWCEHHPESA